MKSLIRKRDLTLIYVRPLASWNLSTCGEYFKLSTVVKQQFLELELTSRESIWLRNKSRSNKVAKVTWWKECLRLFLKVGNSYAANNLIGGGQNTKDIKDPLFRILITTWLNLLVKSTSPEKPNWRMLLIYTRITRTNLSKKRRRWWQRCRDTTPANWETKINGLKFKKLNIQITINNNLK